MKASAFAPGHITGLFSVHQDSEDVLAKGSRGAGWSLTLGAYATVELAEETRIDVEGMSGMDVPVTAAALQQLAPDQNFNVQLRLELPIGQGFGMSAAGTLAATLAAASILDIEPELALHATHAAEVGLGGGLGDAVGAWFGDGELRVKPGCPPHGWAMRVEHDAEKKFIFCILDEPIATSSIIGNQKWIDATREHGDAAVDRLLDHGRDGIWDRIIVESAVFSHKLGLMPGAMASLGARLPDGVSWGQCMLGSTMWVHGTPNELERAAALLEGQGQLLGCGVSTSGAKLVRRWG